MPRAITSAIGGHCGIALVIDDQCVTAISVELAVVVHTGGEHVARQLVSLIQRARSVVYCGGPCKNLAEVLPIAHLNFGQGAAFGSSSLSRVISVAMLR